MYEVSTAPAPRALPKGRIKPHQDFMVVRPRPDIHARLSHLIVQGGEIDTKEFGRVKTDDIISYKHTGVANNFAFGEVLRLGKGFAYGPSSELPEVKTGSIIGFDLCQVAISCPSDEGRKNLVDGSTKLETVYMLPFKAALCRFDVDAVLPVPLGNYLMTEQDNDLMDRFQFASRREGSSKLVLPDTVRAGGIASNDQKNTNIKIAVERVMSHGPGRFAKGVFTTGEFFPGDAAIFLPVMSVDLLAYSKRIRFTPWTQVLATVEL